MIADALTRVVVVVCYSHYLGPVLLMVGRRQSTQTHRCHLPQHERHFRFVFSSVLIQHKLKGEDIFFCLICFGFAPHTLMADVDAHLCLLCTNTAVFFFVLLRTCDQPGRLHCNNWPTQTRLWALLSFLSLSLSSTLFYYPLFTPTSFG